VQCERSYEDVDVLELLDGIRVDTLPVWANKPQPVKSPRTIQIFLASSEELLEERKEFDLYFRQRNGELHGQGICLEIIRWENFFDAMSKTRLQDEYNKAIRNSDICVCLFLTKVGKFTEEEFDVAYSQFKDSGKPYIYTFFKEATVHIGNMRVEDIISLDAFKKKLGALGHFYTSYKSIDDLKLQFRNQLDKLLEEYD